MRIVRKWHKPGMRVSGFLYGRARRESFMDARGNLPLAGAGGKSGVIPIENAKRVKWSAIRAEYIGGGTSYRALAEKHNVSFNALKTRAKKEDWPGLRMQAEHRANTEATQKTAMAAADNATLAANIKRMGLQIIAGLFADYAENVTATEHRETKGKTTDIKRLRDLTAAYKDLTGDMVTGAAEDNALLRSLYDIERGLRDD